MGLPRRSGETEDQQTRFSNALGKQTRHVPGCVRDFVQRHRTRSRALRGTRETPFPFWTPEASRILAGGRTTAGSPIPFPSIPEGSRPPKTRAHPHSPRRIHAWIRVQPSRRIPRAGTIRCSPTGRSGQKRQLTLPALQDAPAPDADLVPRLRSKTGLLRRHSASPLLRCHSPLWPQSLRIGPKWTLGRHFYLRGHSHTRDVSSDR